MRKRLFCIAVPAVALLFCGCDEFDLDAVTLGGSGKIITEKRDVHGFRRVELSGSGNLTISQGNTESLTIEGDDNILPRIKTEVQGDRLRIGMERGVSIHPASPIRYTLVMPELTGVELSGSGKIVAGNFRCQDVTIDLSGSGTIRFDQLTADNLRAEIDGSGNIQMLGRLTRQRVQISGSGDYDAKGLESNSAEVEIDGSGNSAVWVHDDLSAHISGSGNVEYYGSPNVTKRVGGSGKVRSLGDRP